MPFRTSAPGSPRAKALDVAWEAIVKGWQTSPVTQTCVQAYLLCLSVGTLTFHPLHLGLGVQEIWLSLLWLQGVLFFDHTMQLAES